MGIIKKKKIKFILMLITIFILNSCNMVLMNPVGQIGIEEKNLIVTVLILMSLIVVPVIFMTILFTIKYGIKKKKSIYSPNFKNSGKIEFFCWMIPIFIIFIIAIITWKTTHKLDPYKPIKSKKQPINVQVIASNSKWIFIYPKENIATVNEIAIPVNTPINFQITSNCVMNSFFIPSLGSQIYAMPGMQTKLHLIANKTGIYKGFSSSYSGNNFSKMKFNVIIYSNNEKFYNWIRKIQKKNNTLSSIKKIDNINQITKKNQIYYFSSVNKKFYENIVLQFNHTMNK